jgi:hypothetical protein
VLGLVGLVLVSQRRVSRHGDPGAPRGLTGVSTVARIWLFASGAGLLALASGVSLLFAGSGGGDAESTVAAVASSSATSSATAAPSATQAPEVAELDRKDEVFAGGLVLHLPASFEPSDQGYDVLIHFSGNTKVVEESVGAAKMNVALVVANLGQGSGPYMERFGAPASFSKLIEQLDARMAKRGVKVAKTRRVALSSFGAGYGALLQILSSAPNVERIDALLVMEGLYAGYSDKKKKIVDRQRIEPYVRFAKLAKDGSKLFVITHSELQADEYAGTKIVSDAILAELKGERKPADPAKDSPAKVELAAAASLFGKAPAVSLEAKSAAHIGGFHVLGYGGDTAQHHIAHLAQMSTTVLPLLSERWK